MNSYILHVGYPKTASSWLQRRIFNNLELGLKTVPRHIIQNEFLYPNDLDYNEQISGSIVFSEIEKIKNKGLIPVFSHEHITGHALSGGYYNYNLATRLKNLFEKARIIMIIRNQSDMIYSNYLSYIRAGGRCNISRFLNPPKDGRIPLFRHEYFEYHKIIELYFNLFGKENVLILPYELFLKKPEVYISKIVNFINIKEPADLPFDKIENKSIRGVGILMKRFANSFISDYSSESFDTPFTIAKRNSELIKGIFNKVADVTPNFINKIITKRIHRIVEENIEGKYNRSNLLTSDLLKLNLQEFNYRIVN